MCSQALQQRTELSASEINGHRRPPSASRAWRRPAEARSRGLTCIDTRYIVYRYIMPTSVEFHVLLALLNGPRHGYGLMQDVEDLSNGELRLGPGTLYTAIKRLRSSGLISETNADGDRRRCYKLTRKGNAVAEEEARRLQDLVRIARKRGLLPSTS
jgi:DNA-binding PadR family transcriptional regulator